MSNHPIFFDIDTHTTQILPTSSPASNNAELTNPRELQPSTLYSSKATETFLV